MEIMYTAQLTQNILEKRCSIIINKGGMCMKIYIITAETLMDKDERAVEFTLLGAYTSLKKAKKKYKEAEKKFVIAKMTTVNSKSDCWERIGSYYE